MLNRLETDVHTPWLVVLTVMLDCYTQRTYSDCLTVTCP